MVKDYPQVYYPNSIKRFCSSHPLPPVEVTKVEERPKSKQLRPEVPDFPSDLKALLQRFARYLLGLWLVALVGVIGISFVGGLLGLDVLATVSFVAAYSLCLLTVYYWLRHRYLKLRYKYYRKVSEYRSSWQSLQQFQQSQLVTDNSEFNNSQKAHSFTTTQPPPSLGGDERTCALAKLNKDKASFLNSSDARKGVAEEKFFSYLKQYFPEVVWGAEFPTPWQGRNYSADFLAIHPSSGLGISLECDEPYTYIKKKKKPIHCVDQKSDRLRNQFFVEKGWVVVRFAERQIVEAPLSCCKVIAQVIDAVTGDYSFLEQLTKEPDLIPISSWTTREAKKMAKGNYRDSYLTEQ